jgi:hypothetical protein
VTRWWLLAVKGILVGKGISCFWDTCRVAGRFSVASNPKIRMPVHTIKRILLMIFGNFFITIVLTPFPFILPEKGTGITDKLG